MFFILLMIFALLPTLLGWGKLWERMVGYPLGASISEQLLSGVFVLMIGLCLVAFVIPLNGYVEGFTIVIGWLVFFKYKLYSECFILFKKHRELWVALPVLAFVGAFYPFILDHFGYYVPSIKWLSQVGLVKGIANLDLVLGQMSLWHIFQAVFSHFSDIFLRINTLVLVIYAIYIVEKKSYLHWLFIPVLCLFIQSPSPDLPVIVFSLIILDEILRGNQRFSWIMGWSVLIFAIKPTMIWVVPLAFMYLLIHCKCLKYWWIAILVGGVFIAKNLWVFGYPFFPATFLSFGIPWVPNPELMRLSSDIAILKTYDMQFSIEEISRFSTMDFIVNWLTLYGMKAVIHWLFVIILLIFTIYIFIKREIILWILWVSVLVKVFFVLWFSAQYRFFIDIFFVVIFVMLRVVLKENIIRKGFVFFMMIMIIGLSLPQLIQKIVPSFRVAYFMGGITIKQLWEPSHYEYGKVKTYKVGNLKFNVPIDYPFAFDSALPAITISDLEDYYKMGIFPQLYGKTFDKGFCWRILTETERKELANAIKDYNSYIEQEYRGNNK